MPETLQACKKAYELSPPSSPGATPAARLGCFLEGTTILLVIVGPAPTRARARIDPVHSRGRRVNVMIGLVTPPYGLLLS